MNDELGTRLKQHFENRTRYYLPRRTYTIIRVDGRAFHSYTRSCKRPYDIELMQNMDSTAIALCRDIQGAKFGYVQSDEISILVTDFESNTTEAWFDGNIQKIASISASIATAEFNRVRLETMVLNTDDITHDTIINFKMAQFDSRAFTIPDPTEVDNYFRWRMADATRNSISMLAQAHISHAKLQGMNCSEMQEELFTAHGINWNDCPTGFKRGRGIVYKESVKDITYTDRRTGTEHTVEGVMRGEWVVDHELPIFTQNREYLDSIIPKYT